MIYLRQPFLFDNCCNDSNYGILYKWNEICGQIIYTLMHRFDDSKQELSTSDLFDYLQKAFRLNLEDFKNLLHQAKERPVSKLQSRYEFFMYKGVASTLTV